jgi:hypothetical protein
LPPLYLMVVTFISPHPLLMALVKVQSHLLSGLYLEQSL